MRHTVIIPSHNTLEHLKNTYKSVIKYGNGAKMIIIDDASTDGTKEWLTEYFLNDVYNDVEVIISKQRRGHTYWYDEGMRRADTEIVSILHSDMIIGPNYFDNMLKHLKRGKVVCATRIEPPIHPAGREKIVRNFGDEAKDFLWDTFEKFVLKEKEEQKDVTTQGMFAPWMLYKEDHLSIGGHDQRFAPYGYEDSDIFNRWILAGYEMVQSRDALCYHMTCRGHRWNAGVGIENSDYRSTMDRCRREYIRKWGDWIHNDEYQMPIIYPRYNRGIVLKNGNINLVTELEPWADTLYTDFAFEEYIVSEQAKTVVNLKEKVLPLEHSKNNHIFIEVDGNNITQQDFIYIQQLSAILSKSKPAAGEFKLGNLKLLIIKYHEEKIHS